MAHGAKNICCLVLYRKSLPIPELKNYSFSLVALGIRLKFVLFGGRIRYMGAVVTTVPLEECVRKINPVKLLRVH